MDRFLEGSSSPCLPRRGAGASRLLEGGLALGKGGADMSRASGWKSPIDTSIC
jgi:hypothetical protein